MLGRRLATVVGAMLTILALTATAAFAHICYNASRSDTGNANAARSQALGSGTEFLGLLQSVGCTAEADALEAALTADGLDPANILVNERAVMARGVVGKSQSLDGRGIDHLLPYLDQIEAAGACLAANAPA